MCLESIAMSMSQAPIVMPWVLTTHRGVNLALSGHRTIDKGCKDRNPERYQKHLSDFSQCTTMTQERPVNEVTSASRSSILDWSKAGSRLQ